MTEEEKEAIDIFIDKVNKYDESIEIKGVSVGEEMQILDTVVKALNLIEYYKSQKSYDDQLKNELLETIRCKGLEIDSLNKILDDRLVCIQGGRGLYAKLRGLDKEYIIREYLSMYKMCKQEIAKKDKIIDLMLIGLINTGDFYGMSKEEVKQYFEKKVSDEDAI